MPITTNQLYWCKEEKKYKKKKKKAKSVTTLEELKKAKRVFELLNQGRK